MFGSDKKSTLAFMKVNYLNKLIDKLNNTTIGGLNQEIGSLKNQVQELEKSVLKVENLTLKIEEIENLLANYTLHTHEYEDTTDTTQTIKQTQGVT